MSKKDIKTKAMEANKNIEKLYEDAKRNLMDSGATYTQMFFINARLAAESYLAGGETSRESFLMLLGVNFDASKVALKKDIKQ